VADLSTLATNIQRQVSGSVRDIKRELREATRQARTPSGPSWPSGGRGRDWANREWANREWAGDGEDPQGDRGHHAGRATGRDRGHASGDTRGRTDASDANDHTSDADLADLAQALQDLAGEVRQAARQAGVGANEIRSATAVVIGAITELRRLLRR
jgi:hypothetical protein